MDEDQNQVHVRETYTYSREVSGSNPERLMELLQDARRAVGNGLPPEGVANILDRAIDEVAGRKPAPALAQPPGIMVGNVPVVAAELTQVNGNEQIAEELKK